MGIFKDESLNESLRRSISSLIKPEWTSPFEIEHLKGMDFHTAAAFLRHHKKKFKISVRDNQSFDSGEWDEDRVLLELKEDVVEIATYG
jgi:hypothetical protein